MSDTTIFTPASTPESIGIPSQAVLRFIQRLDTERICMHGFLLVRHGKVAAEGYWAPYAGDSMHRMYSVSKSFVSLAVGLMVDQGQLHLDDQVVKFFPDKQPDKVHPYLESATVRDLLMMATPHNSTTYTRTDKDWAWTFFNKKPSHPPGTLFSYDTSATVTLTTIVERISGMPFLEYMRPFLLDPIGFSADAWCIQCPEGTSWGGSGVICTLKDMAKVAWVCMNGGRWGQRQLLPEGYVQAATSKQIDNSLGGNWGYGYQIWREQNNGFAFRGMGSQLAICYPDKDFLFACTADTQGADLNKKGGRRGILAAMRQELYAELSDGALPADPGALRSLEETIGTLTILPQDGARESAMAGRIDGTWYAMADNPMGIERMRLVFDGDEGAWKYTNAQGDNRLRFGIGNMVAGEFPQRNYFGPRIGTAPGTPYQCLASAAWVEPHKLDMLIYITDHYLGSLRISMAFKNDEVSVLMVKAAEWFLDEYQGFAGGAVAGAQGSSGG